MNMVNGMVNIEERIIRKGSVLRGNEILSREDKKNRDTYRGIMEVAARFGYFSVQEIMYGLHLSLIDACNRLNYLRKIKLPESFPSQSIPESLYCLTNSG